jgi:hypothetical protein
LIPNIFTWKFFDPEFFKCPEPAGISNLKNTYPALLAFTFRV